MSASHWHKRYHSDALTGFMSLTLEERGAYQTLLDMIYDRGGPIVDNDRLLAGYMGVSVRKWLSIKEQLVRKEKILVHDGLISNERAIFEIENRAKTSRKLAENGMKGGRKKSDDNKLSNENNENENQGLSDGLSLSRSQKLEAAKAASAGEEKPSDAVSLMIALHKAAGLVPPDPANHWEKHTEAVALAASWLKAGADPAMLEQCVAARAKSSSSTPKSLKYFDGAVRDALKNREIATQHGGSMINDILARAGQAA